MLCTEQARNSLSAWSPCLAHGQHFHLPLRLQILLSWRQLHLPLPVFLPWQNTSGKLIRSILPDATQNSQASNCFLKRLCPTANPAPPQNSISWKGKYMHGIFGRVPNRKKKFRHLLYIKGPIYMTGGKKKKEKNSQNKRLLSMSTGTTVGLNLVVPLGAFFFFFFSTKCVV